MTRGPKTSALIHLIVAGLVFTLGTSPALAAGGGGGGGESGGSLGPGARGASRIAAKKYESALEYIAKAHDIEKDLPDIAPEDRAKREKQARKHYEKALDKLDSALRRDPARHEAHSDRGYVLRKLGQFEDALEAYDEALSLAPRYAPAIEYRGEAYLELARLDEAKRAHTRLMRIDSALASQLLEKMQAWVARHSDELSDTEGSEVTAFSEWVAARSASADSKPSGGNSTDRW